MPKLILVFKKKKKKRYLIGLNASCCKNESSQSVKWFGSLNVFHSTNFDPVIWYPSASK